MNIIHICACGHGPNGIKTALRILSAKQQESGNDVRVFSVYKGTDDFKYIHTIKEFTAEIKQSRPDIVIFHSVYHAWYIPFALILAFKGIPYSIELHGALSNNNYKVSHLKKVIANLLCFNAFIKFAKGIIYLNEAEYKNSIVKDINPKSSIVPNGCDIVPGITPKAYQSDQPIKIIYMGRIDRHHKGLDLLIQAIDDNIDKFVSNNIKFLFYGDGTKVELEWFECALTNISAVVEFKGPVYGEAKHNALSDAHLFVLTSRSEGMPMGVLEALSYGLPCILTPNTNVGEHVCSAGAGKLTSLDTDHIAKSILEFVEEYKTGHIRLQDCAIKLSKTYSWDTISATSISEYRKMISAE